MKGPVPTPGLSVFHGGEFISFLPVFRYLILYCNNNKLMHETCCMTLTVFLCFMVHYITIA